MSENINLPNQVIEQTENSLRATDVTHIYKYEFLSLSERKNNEEIRLLRGLIQERAKYYRECVETFVYLPMVVMTNGGILPTLQVLHELNNVNPMDIQVPIVVASKQPGKNKVYKYSNSTTYVPDAFILEDINDTNETEGILSSKFVNSIYLPFTKKASTKFEWNGYRIVQIPDMWGCSGFGMNSGLFPSDYAESLGLTKEQMVEISVLERCSIKVFIQADGANKNKIIQQHEAYKDLLLQNQLPDNFFRNGLTMPEIRNWMIKIELTNNLSQKESLIANLFTEMGIQYQMVK